MMIVIVKTMMSTTKSIFSQMMMDLLNFLMVKNTMREQQLKSFAMMAKAECQDKHALRGLEQLVLRDSLLTGNVLVKIVTTWLLGRLAGLWRTQIERFL